MCITCDNKFKKKVKINLYSETEPERETTVEQYLTNLLGKEATEKVILAIDSGLPVIIDGLQGPTGKSTLEHLLNKIGITALQRYKLKKSNNNSASVVITLNEYVI